MKNLLEKAKNAEGRLRVNQSEIKKMQFQMVDSNFKRDQAVDQLNEIKVQIELLKGEREKLITDNTVLKDNLDLRQQDMDSHKKDKQQLNVVLKNEQDIYRQKLRMIKQELAMAKMYCEDADVRVMRYEEMYKKILRKLTIEENESMFLRGEFIKYSMAKIWIRTTRENFIREMEKRQKIIDKQTALMAEN